MEKSAERIAFEEWADDGFALTLLWDDEAGEYCNPTIQAEWNAWNTAWYLSAIHQAKQPQDTEQASQPQVMEGYKLVPEVATWDMIIAATETELTDYSVSPDDETRMTTIGECSAVSIYDAMLEAAPAAPENAIK